MNRVWRGQIGWFVVCLGLLVACGDDAHDGETGHTGEHGEHGEGGEHGEHGAVEEACEHMAEGPFEDVTATATTDDAPSATYAHTSVHITLVADPADADNNIGYVTFAADEAADFAFFLSADVGFEIFDATGAEVEIEESADVDDCAEVAKEHVAELEVGTYTLSFGPTTEAMVSLVVEEAAHEGHEDGDEDHED